MEQSDKLNLNEFLNKVKRLRGFGDMDSYVLVNQAKKLIEIQQTEFETIIKGFAQQETWHEGKQHFINTIEENL